MKTKRSFSLTTLFLLVLVVLANGRGRDVLANQPPVAEAGLRRYAAVDPVLLDGTGSHDPDGSGTLSYTWRQVSGPPVTITNATSATPSIRGPNLASDRGEIVPGPFVQTQAVQECEFELVVSDGELTSAPDTVKVIIVPAFTACTMALENPAFDPRKPTVLFFHGGSSTTTGGGRLNDPLWSEKANIISFPSYVGDPDTAANQQYERPGDMIIVYLSKVAPNYRQPIQTWGWSIGGLVALDVARRLNLTYADARYAVNHAALIDPSSWVYGQAEYYRRITELLAHPVDAEQCWVDCYEAANSAVCPGTLNIVFAPDHALPWNYYRTSLATVEGDVFNSGLVAGAYWSVVGPGKNLQLALTPEVQTYKFRWTGSATAGEMTFLDELHYPACLPEPVTLGAWATRSEATGEIDGALLSCYHGENVVGYQLLFGSDPDRVMDFQVVSDTPAPPMEVLHEFPAGAAWWTIRARDRYGSTIHADPILLDLTNLPPLSVQNARTGKRYGFIRHAMVDANAGDVIMLAPAAYEESVEFGGKTLTLTSVDPNNPEIVAGTILRGRGHRPSVVFGGPESTDCVLVGLTIQSDTVGVSCRDAVPMIRNCVLEDAGGIALEYWWGCPPNLVDCTVLGQVKEGGDPGLVAYWQLDESEGMLAHDVAGGHNGIVVGTPHWRPQGGTSAGALELDGKTAVAADSTLNPADGPFSMLVWSKGGAPGQVIVSQQGGANWLMAHATGALMTELSKGGRTGMGLSSQAVITDGDWHRLAFTWDGASRRLYVDGALAAEDAQEGLAAAYGKLVLGAGKTMSPATFWTGLIDDVRIYNRAVQP